MDTGKRPHYILILISTMKATAVIFLFFIVAVSLSPNKSASAINLAQMLVPIIIAIYAYVMYFWYSVSVTLDQEKIDFRMKVGRKNQILVNYSEIEDIKLKQGVLEKIFKVSRLSLVIRNIPKTYGDDITVMEHYLLFKTEEAEKIAIAIQEKM